MFGKLALAVLVCTGFVACSSDDETTNPNGGVISGKKITMLVQEEYNQNGYTNTETYILDYDVDGKLFVVFYNGVSGMNGLNYTYESTHEYTWSNDAIYTDGEIKGGYVLKNNLIQKVNDPHGETFTYNNSKRLANWKEYGGSIETTYTTSLTWEGDKLISMTHKLGNTIREKETITYGGCCNAGYNPLIAKLAYGGVLFYAHPELLGLRSAQLPISITTESDEIWSETGTRNYEYEFDEAGYITKIVGKVESEIVETWTITWE